MHSKSNLPTKICVVCGRPFSWRKKWKNNWAEVKYCSDACRRCRSAKHSARGAAQNVPHNASALREQT